MSIRKAERPRNLSGSYVADIRDFIASGWDCAEVDVEDAKRAYHALRRNLDRHAEFSCVNARMRDGRVFLVREDA